MGLFGGGNSTSSTTAQSSGFSQIGGSALQLQGSQNSITLSDSGAIAAGQNIALAALQGGQSIAGEALDQAQLVSNSASNTASAAIQAVAASAQGQTESILLEGIKWAALVALGFLALKLFKG